MQNNKNKLTVIIPTICRHLLYHTALITSKEPDIDIIIVVDSQNAVSNLLLHLISDRVKVIYNDLVPGPGGTKMRGIEEVSTPYFTILDDDDWFISGYLKYASYLLDNFPDCHWISSHNTSEDLGEFSLDYEIIDSLELIKKRYFDFEKYDTHLEQLCPSHLIYRTKTFKNYILTGYHYKGYNNDDILPQTDFCFKYIGINHRGYGYHYTRTPNSVMRSKVKVGLIQDKIMTISELASRGGDFGYLWARVLKNMLNIINYNNGKC
jgi:hypothetical protein